MVCNPSVIPVLPGASCPLLCSAQPLGSCTQQALHKCVRCDAQREDRLVQEGELKTGKGSAPACFLGDCGLGTTCMHTCVSTCVNVCTPVTTPTS